MKKFLIEYFTLLLMILPFTGCIISIIMLGLLLFYKNDITELQDPEFSTNFHFYIVTFNLTICGIFSAWTTSSMFV